MGKFTIFKVWFKSKIESYFRKNCTILGRILWILNCVLVIFYFDYILYVILSPYGFLNQFVAALITIINFLFAVLIFFYNFKLFGFLEKLALFYHVLSFLFLTAFYFVSIKYLWKNKEEYYPQ
jgi:hypothetical protein